MTVEPNRYAGPLEEAMLRENILVEEADLDRVHERLKGARQRLREAQLAFAAAQEAMDTASAIVEQTEEHEATLTRSLTRSHGLLHPIRRLPSEVLAMIFLQRRDDETDADFHYMELCLVPFWMASVCKKWRSVALGTPLLWAHIGLDLDLVQERVQPWDEYLLRSIRYSGRAALSLRLTTAVEGNESPPITRIWLQLRHALRRARFLHVHCYSLSYSKFRQFIQDEAPLLEFCLIDCCDESASPAAMPIMSTAPRLRDLRVVEVDIDWSVGKRYDSLQKLTFNVTGTIFASDFATAASRFPNMMELKLNVSLEAPTPTTINFAVLRIIRIGMVVDSNAAQSFHLPALEEASFDVPSSGLIALMLRTSLSRSPKLSKLAIHFISANEEISNAVAVHANLTELVLRDCNMTDEFCRNFARPDSSGHWPCPRLSTLHVQDIRPTPQRLTFDGAALLDLVRARRGTPSSAQPCTLSNVTATWESGADYSREGFHEELAQLML